eukprot:scaffold442_cov397-Prasinococcus_capsulatus_cf.AAC.39
MSGRAPSGTLVVLPRPTAAATVIYMIPSTARLHVPVCHAGRLTPAHGWSLRQVVLRTRCLGSYV